MQVDGAAQTLCDVRVIGREVNRQTRHLLWHLGTMQVDQLGNRAVLACYRRIEATNERLVRVHRTTPEAKVWVCLMGRSSARAPSSRGQTRTNEASKGLQDKDSRNLGPSRARFKGFVCLSPNATEEICLWRSYVAL